MILKSLGDAAVIAYLPDEDSAATFGRAISAADYPWLFDVVPAYKTVGVFFDPAAINLDGVRTALTSVKVDSTATAPGKIHVIPCCYQLGPDLDHVAELKGLTPSRIIELHSSVEYAVYAIGFTPGFPYLGYLPSELEGVPRLASPRMRVKPGSVGVAGRQTGVYPLPRPGGWHLIGRTPTTMVDVAAGHFPLRVGDRVRFAPIAASDFPG